ncbi:PREDICTED: putative F-box/kelch-repeat protein At1g62270, partial [Camelina sativa]|uniref:F-box/kelch-repeat protein At1g62270 n=1 Tax=Camelina sativa TaxID=90675 RepID=A0ABM1RAY8_CAMSA
LSSERYDKRKKHRQWRCQIFHARALGEVTLSCVIQSRGVSLNGDTYWIASQVKDFVLVSFDFTTETFGRLNLPSDQCLGYEVLALSVVREEQLSVLQQSQDTSNVKIWVTTNDETDQTKVLSWRKFLAVDLNTYNFYHKFTYDVSFFIKDEEKKVAICFDNGIAYIFGENRDFGKVYIDVSDCPAPVAVSQAWFKFSMEAIGNITNMAYSINGQYGEQLV